MPRRPSDFEDRLFGVLIVGFGFLALIAFGKTVLFSTSLLDLLTTGAIVSGAFFFYLRWRIFGYLQYQLGGGVPTEEWIRYALRVFSMRSPVAVGLDRQADNPNPSDNRVGDEE